MNTNSGDEGEHCASEQRSHHGEERRLADATEIGLQNKVVKEMEELYEILRAWEPERGAIEKSEPIFRSSCEGDSR